MDNVEIMEMLLEAKASKNNTIDLNAYAQGMEDMANAIKNNGDIASVSEIPNGVLAKNKCEEIMQELDNLVVNKDHLPVFKNYFELGLEKCYNWIRVSSR